jgi:hypothetical protein
LAGKINKQIAYELGVLKRDHGIFSSLSPRGSGDGV